MSCHSQSKKAEGVSKDSGVPGKCLSRQWSDWGLSGTVPAGWGSLEEGRSGSRCCFVHMEKMTGHSSVETVEVRCRRWGQETRHLGHWAVVVLGPTSSPLGGR